MVCTTRNILSKALTNRYNKRDIIYDQAKKRDTAISYGYNTALEVMEEILLGFIVRQKEIDPDFSSPYFEFNQVIAEKYNEDPNLRWPVIINKQLGIIGNPLENSIAKDRNAIELFYNLLDEFYK